MHRHDHKEREPKAFPQYDDAAHIDSAAVAELPPWEQTREPKGDPKATAYLSLIHISEPTRPVVTSRMPSSA